MLMLSNGLRIRVDIDIDPCWSKTEIYRARNLYLRFKKMGYSNVDSNSFASAIIWKAKWKGTIYGDDIERLLHNIMSNSVTELPLSS